MHAVLILARSAISRHSINPLSTRSYGYGDTKKSDSQKGQIRPAACRKNQADCSD